MPAFNSLVGRWAAKMERSRVSTFIFVGVNAGNAVALAASGALFESGFLGGWPSVFYVFGMLSRYHIRATSQGSSIYLFKPGGEQLSSVSFGVTIELVVVPSRDEKLSKTYPYSLLVGK